MTCDHTFEEEYLDCEHLHCSKCDVCQSKNGCTHIRYFMESEIKQVLQNLSKEFSEAGYLSHEQRYKTSCRVDEVLKFLIGDRR